MMAAVYARKPTEKYVVAGERRSLARRSDHARTYAVNKGRIVADEHVYVDDGISGAEFSNRHGFLRLMNALKPRPSFQVLVMSEESRLGHEAIETADALKQFTTAADSEAVINANPDVSALVVQLTSSSIAVRARAAAALGAHRHAAVVIRLATVLRDDPDEFVRAAAASALVCLGTVQPIEVVGAALRDQSGAVQMEAVVALSSKPAEPVIRTMLNTALPGPHGAARRVTETELGVS